MLGKRSERDSQKALEYALALDIQHFDTAQSYGYGLGEAWLGQQLSKRAPNANVLTKYGIPPALGLRANAIRALRSGWSGIRAWRWRSAEHGSERWSHDAILNAAEVSRSSRRQAQLWGFLLHAPGVQLATANFWRDALFEVQRKGWAQHVGVSCGASEVAAFSHPGIDLQFSQNLLSPAAATSQGMRWINHVFSGRNGFHILKDELLKRLQRLDSEWFEQISQSPQLLLECLLRTSMHYGGANAAVLAMFSREHQRENVAALFSPQLPDMLIHELSTRIASGFQC